VWFGERCNLPSNKGVNVMTAVSRIAFVSDVHGNLPALEAVLEELQKLEPFDRVVGGGDYAAGGAYPQECLARVRPLGWDFVRGNADEWMVEIATGGRIPAKGHVPEAVPNAAVRELLAWGAGRLGDDDIDFLAGLELVWSMTGPSGQNLVFAHATPTSTHISFPPDAADSIVLPMFDETGADVFLHGHIHYAYLRQTSKGMLGCVGSVGLPFDRDPRPCFLIATDDGTGWHLEHRRVTYDNESYAVSLIESGIPHAEDAARHVRTADRQ
jgi:predicted phosphodiesterase